MKRLHVHAAVDDLAASARFRSTLFAAEPIVAKPGYGKWMLDDPWVDFAIPARSGNPGPDHRAIQVDTQADLPEVFFRAQRADADA